MQLLRIQNDLNQLALAMRDMIDTPDGRLLEWEPRFSRLRADLDDALAREGQVAVTPRPQAQAEALAGSVTQFWTTTSSVFSLAREGRDADARRAIRESLQARQGDLSSAVGRLCQRSFFGEATMPVRRAIQATNGVRAAVMRSERSAGCQTSGRVKVIIGL